MGKGDNQLKIEGDLPFTFNEAGLFDSSGKAYAGVINDGFNASFRADIKSFCLRGLNTFNTEDPWRDLTLMYQSKFPVDLVLSPAVLDQFKNIFRLLFPLKRVEYHLNSCWKTITAVSKSALSSDERERSSSGGAPTQRASVFAAALRAQMAGFVEGLLAYFYTDVLEVRWGRLKLSLLTLTEFDELRRIVSNYLESIYIHTFLNLPKIIANIFDLLVRINKFIAVVERMGQQTTETISWNDEEFSEEIKQIHNEFDWKIKEFITQIKTLNQISSSECLSQLLTRLNFNEYYSGYSDGLAMDIEH
jgi:Gamma tubulin complex component C-terminal